MYNPWDLEIWDIVYIELKDWDNYVYMEWKWEIIGIYNNSTSYPLYIRRLSRHWSTNARYSEVVRVIEYKKQEESLKKPFYFIRC